MRRDHAALPVEIAGGEGLLEGVVFQQQPKGGDLLEILGRHRRDFEAALSFGDDQSFRAHPVQEFAKRGDRGAVALADLFQLELLAGQAGRRK